MSKVVRFGWQSYGRFGAFRFGPLGYIAFHLHATPNERTERGAFSIAVSLSITGEMFGRDFRYADVLRDEEWWGLCSRMGPFEDEKK